MWAHCSRQLSPWPVTGTVVRQSVITGCCESTKWLISWKTGNGETKESWRRRRETEKTTPFVGSPVARAGSFRERNTNPVCQGDHTQILGKEIEEKEKSYFLSNSRSRQAQQRFMVLRLISPERDFWEGQACSLIRGLIRSSLSFVCLCESAFPEGWTLGQ